MNYQEVEERIKAGYRQVRTQYRRDDEIEVQTENHRRLCQALKRICASFDHPIAVLDAGCGTGRYFHCLENVESLVGLDISEEMLEAALHPVLQEQVRVRNITLKRGNIFLTSFPAESFDLIYSLGMFGHGCPVTVEICDRFHDWLKPGGRLLFNIVDFSALPWWYRARRRLRTLIYPVLTKNFQRKLDQREQLSPFFSLTKRQLEGILTKTKFKTFDISSHECLSPLWRGKHLECRAAKPVTATSNHQGAAASGNEHAYKVVLTVGEAAVAATS